MFFTIPTDAVLVLQRAKSFRVTRLCGLCIVGLDPKSGIVVGYWGEGLFEYTSETHSEYPKLYRSPPALFKQASRLAHSMDFQFVPALWLHDDFVVKPLDKYVEGGSVFSSGIRGAGR